ncbi:MAG: hypothetical protein HC788_10915 [Sphingopyxis sp.]|nr:hypothetical protein [Sphingopyxis sp.]
MFKKLIKKLVRKIVKSPLAAEVIAEKADDAIMDVLDAKTGGLASKAEEAVKRRNRERDQ